MSYIYCGQANYISTKVQQKQRSKQLDSARLSISETEYEIRELLTLICVIVMKLCI